MDLYTLNPNFLDKDVVDEYVSAIWTERYSEAGDCQLVVPATADNIVKLKEGTFLALRGSKEVMILETQSIEKGLMTVVGKTLPIFLNNRAVWFKNPAFTGGAATDRIVDYTDATKKPGQFIADVVDKMVINPVAFPSGGSPNYFPANLDWANDKIPFLSLGAVDASGVVKRLTAPVGPLYDAISNLAKQEDVGFSLYLQSANPDTGYVLKFTTYKGVDRTSSGPGNLVRLTRDLDGIQDIKEVNSVSKYKNVAYVYYKGEISIHYAEPSLPIPEGFDRRIMVVNPEGEPVARSSYQASWGYGSSYAVYYVGPADIAAFREQAARDALANNNYIHAIDGQTSPITDYVYGVDYSLGDTIELEGYTGNLTKAKITEYIRSEDATGEKAYPTISVIE